ncbi:MAG: beta-1,3-glucanase family protein [Methylocella sp.]
MPNVSGLECGKRAGRQSVIGTWLRRVLSVAAFLSLAVPSLALGQGFNNEGLPVIPFTVVNNFNTTVPLYVYIKGQVNPEDIRKNSPLTPDSRVYVTDLTGDIAAVPYIPSGYTGMLALNLGTAKTTSMMFPKLNGVRIYFSFVNPTMVCCNTAVGGAPSEPTGWVTTDPNYNTVFDWAELAWDNGGNTGLGHTTRLGGNLTQVDMFGMPMRLSLGGQSTTIGNTPITQKAGFTSNRPTILSAYLQLGTPWTTLFLTNSGGPLPRLRVISPYHGIALGLFPPKKLDTYISQVFTFYTSNTLMTSATCPQDNITHTLAGNTITGGFLVFKDAGVERFRFATPSTLTVYQNEISAIPAPDNPATPGLNACLGGAVAAKLGGAFIRTTLLVLPSNNLDTYCMTPALFYVNTPAQKYAQIFHTFGINHLAYSFGYDDSCDQSSYISVDDPTAMTITLGGG